VAESRRAITEDPIVSVKYPEQLKRVFAKKDSWVQPQSHQVSDGVVGPREKMLYAVKTVRQ
jgi:hypothetical protein